MTERYLWKEVDMSGDRSKVENSFMFFVYTPVFTISLASKENKPKLLAILRPLPFGIVFFLLSKLKDI